MLRKGIRKIGKRVLFPLLNGTLKLYTKEERFFDHKGVQLKIKPTVFHPGLYLSTKILMGFLDTLELEKKTFLELGAGSGAVGFYAERLGAKVTLSDINKKAIEGLLENKGRLSSTAEVVHSDLFEQLDTSFDVVVVNPPYYPKAPENEEQMAWFCGEEYEYFQRFFSGLKKILHASSNVYMILSEDCQIQKIKAIANKHGFTFELHYKKMKLLEWNYVYLIS